MFAKPETELVDLIKQSPIAKKLRVIDSLPDLDDEELVRRFAVDAPAAYVIAQTARVSGGVASPLFSVVAVARNGGGHHAVRHGDGQAIGLYQMIDALASTIEGSVTPSCAWAVDEVAFVDNKALTKNGLYVARMAVSTEIELSPPVDEAALDRFATFAADYDAPPHEAAGEHEKWLEEPPDHSTSVPDASDNVALDQ